MYSKRSRQPRLSVRFFLIIKGSTALHEALHGYCFWNGKIFIWKGLCSSYQKTRLVTIGKQGNPPYNPSAEARDCNRKPIGHVLCISDIVSHYCKTALFK